MMQILGCTRPPQFLQELLQNKADLGTLLNATFTQPEGPQRDLGCVYLAKSFPAQDFSLEQFKQLLTQGPQYLAYHFLHPDPEKARRTPEFLSFDKVQFLLENPALKLNGIYQDQQSMPAERALIIAGSQAALDSPTIRTLASYKEVAEQLPIIRPDAVLDSALTQAVIQVRAGRDPASSIEAARLVIKAA